MPDSSPLARLLVLSDPQIGLYQSMLSQAEQVNERLEAAGREQVALPRIQAHEREELLFSEAIAAANELRPDAVVVCGDMIQHWDSDEELSLLRTVVGRLDPSIPIHWVPGNHDVAPDTFRPTLEGLARYAEAFGPDRYAAEIGRVRLIVINSSSIHSPDLVPAEREANLGFMEAELAEADRRDQIPIVCSHHPWFLDAGHSAAALVLPEEQRDRLLEIARIGRLRTLVSGHIHGNNVDSAGELQQITTTATGLPFRDDPSGYRIVEVYDDRVEHEARALPSGPGLQAEAELLLRTRSLEVD
jgi:3',5'-cyclic AMP phosphodiesterase CpdA